MSKRLYVGNLPFLVNDQDLKEIFSNVGPVVSAQVVSDPRSQRSKGYGFVEMESAGDAEKAIQTYDGGEIDGRPLKVMAAKSEGPKTRAPREDKNQSASTEAPSTAAEAPAASAEG